MSAMFLAVEAKRFSLRAIHCMNFTFMKVHEHVFCAWPGDIGVDQTARGQALRGASRIRLYIEIAQSTWTVLRRRGICDADTEKLI